MFSKIIAALIIVLAVYIALPFGFGLWNESLGIRGQISFAESPVPTEEIEASGDMVITPPAASPLTEPEVSVPPIESEPPQSAEPKAEEIITPSVVPSPAPQAEGELSTEEKPPAETSDIEAPV